MKRKIELKLLDDKTDPNQVTTNIKTLISSDKVAGLLGSCTPDLVNPGAVVADSQQVPFVTGCAGHPQPPGAQPPAVQPTTQDTPSARPVTSTPSPAVVVGVPGHYRIGERQLTFLEPAHTGPTGQYVGQRTLATTVWYPRAGSQP